MIWLAFILTLGSSLVLTGVIRRYALARNLIDIPNQRSSHTLATPHGGGVAIVVTFQVVLGVLAFNGYLPISSFWLFLIAGSWIAGIGLLDDIYHIPARWRLLFHFAAASLVVYWLGGIPPIPIAGPLFISSWLGSTVAVIILVWLLNLYNFMDGIDGIAGIEAITVCAGGLLIYALFGTSSSQFIPPLMLIAATLGFLFWNFPRARIFMGDTGSGYIGFIVGLFAIQAAWVSPELIWSWVVLLGAFIVDATVTLIRRVLRGEKFYEAHRSHAYQYASRRYGSHIRISLACGMINLFWLLPLAILVAGGWLDGILALLIAYLPLIWLAFYLKAGDRELQEV
jgi:Fuc2NAc and GlcNAc transferase